jgi:transposase InsO family protein
MSLARQTGCRAHVSGVSRAGLYRSLQKTNPKKKRWKSGRRFQEVDLNLASRMKLTGVNQLWVADITYIRFHRDFVCLAVILDLREAPTH